ncbi:MAG: UDP-2,3-diacylglucosamine diphosphatase [Limnohabitans sp.]
MAAPLPATLTTLDLRHCQRIAFLSDVHLQANEPVTFQAWAEHLHTLSADALFILGDLFDVWLGDDILQHPSAVFERECLARLRSLSQTLPIYGLVGNRDFLFGPTACAAAGITAISDPCLVQADSQPWLVSHGDALCLSDTAYQAYRKTIRASQSLVQLNASSLQDRIELAKTLKAHSLANKTMMDNWADVDENACVQWLKACGASVLIHGHTHMPQDHRMTPPFERIVLSDWEASATPPRLQSVVWQRGTGFSRHALPRPITA